MAKKRQRRKASENPWPARLKALRKRLGLSQPEAAAQLDVPVATWRNWEQGRNRPSTAMGRIIDITFKVK